MKYQTILCIILSLLIIILTHRFYDFLKNTLTIPKVKDLVDKPQKRYSEILTKLDKHNNNCDNKKDQLLNTNILNKPNVESISSNMTIISDDTNQQMKDELLNILKRVKLK